MLVDADGEEANDVLVDVRLTLELGNGWSRRVDVEGDVATPAARLHPQVALFNTELYASTGAIADLFNVKALILAAVLLAATRCIKKLKGLHPIVFILASAVIGIVFSF